MVSEGVNSTNNTPRRNKTHNNKACVNIDIFDTVLYALVDSGSPVSIIDQNILPNDMPTKIIKTMQNLTSANVT